MKLDMGVMLHTGDMPYNDIIRYAQEAEALGYHGFWLTEESGKEAFSLLGVLARETKRINLCTGIVNFYSRSPTTLAMSARSLHDPHLPEMVEQVLETTGAGPGQLTLEITESAIVLDPKRAEKTLARLGRMGVWLSIDDFGTGYTSLASIKHLLVNEIKIDKSFVMGMLATNSDAMIVRSVIDLGHNLGLRVVAEGVETKETFDALATLDCDEAQGYFISRPQACELLMSWFPTSPWKIGPAG